jgi:hypothetical protein
MKKIYPILLLIVVVAHQSCMNSVNDVDFPMTIKNSELIMSHGNTEKLIVENTKGFTTYKSTNEDVATVSPYGVVSAGIKGEANIIVESGAETAVCKVLVNTTINHIVEPCVDFGSDYETVKDKIKNAAEITEVNGNIVQTRNVENTIFRYAYLFKEGKLYSSCLSFPLQSFHSRNNRRFFGCLFNDSIFNMCFIYCKSEFPVYHFLKSELRALLTMILSGVSTDKLTDNLPPNQTVKSVIAR